MTHQLKAENHNSISNFHPLIKKNVFFVTHLGVYKEFLFSYMAKAPVTDRHILYMGEITGDDSQL